MPVIWGTVFVGAAAAWVLGQALEDVGNAVDKTGEGIRDASIGVAIALAAYYGGRALAK